MSVLRESVRVLPAAALGLENPLPDLQNVGDVHGDIVIDPELVYLDERN